MGKETLIKAIESWWRERHTKSQLTEKEMKDLMDHFYTMILEADDELVDD